MLVPNARNAVVEESKIRDYLLQPTHPGNGGKAAFFKAMGYDGDRWNEFAAAMRVLVETHDVTSRQSTIYGEKFVVEGQIVGPNGRTGIIRTVWIDEGLDTLPRLVTAYPV